MLMKHFLTCHSDSLEEYAAQRKKMNVFYGVMIFAGLATVLFVQLIVPRFLPIEDEHTAFFKGLYTGVGFALMAVGILFSKKNVEALKDPEKLKRARLEEADERNRAITAHAMRAAMPVMVAALYLGMLVVGAFDMAVFWFCFGMILLFAACFVGLLSYYDHKM